MSAAQRTKTVIESAMGGVLFIDEAYSICSDPYDRYPHKSAPFSDYNFSVLLFE